MSAHTNTPRVLIFDHINGEFRTESQYGFWQPVIARRDPPGPLRRVQDALWRRPRGRPAGNALSSARYWLWRLCR